MIGRIVLAVLVGIVTFLVCSLVGTLFSTVDIDFVATIGSFLEKYASLIGLIAALWFYFSNRIGA